MMRETHLEETEDQAMVLYPRKEGLHSFVWQLVAAVALLVGGLILAIGDHSLRGSIAFVVCIVGLIVVLPLSVPLGVAAVSLLRRASPLLVIDDEGIHNHLTLSRSGITVTWEEIRAVSLYSKSLCVSVLPASKHAFLSRHSLLTRWLLLWNLTLLRMAFFVPERILAIPGEEVVSHIRSFAQRRISDAR